MMMRRRIQGFLAFVVLLRPTSSFAVRRIDHSGLDRLRSAHCHNVLSGRHHKSNGLYAKKKKRKSSSTATVGIKGFGSSTIQSDRSKETRSFYEQFLEKGGAGDNLKRTALGLEPSVPFALRGVLCTRDIAKGIDIINIPSSLAINLGPEGDDPTLPALAFLEEYCTVMRDPRHPRYPYFSMLPGYQSVDSLGSTDFYSDEALEALQSPRIVEETLDRRAQTQARFSAIEASPWLWVDATTPVTSEHLQWAVWLITSRVLTVQTQDEDSPPCRLLIPYLDMCNHERSSPHVLMGRVGGSLRIVAGAPVKAGSPIHIAYGGGVAGNNRFVQDYGFLDSDGFDAVALELLGKRRVQEGRDAGKFLSTVDQELGLTALRTTSIADDEALLKDKEQQDPSIRTAIQYRLGVKRALSKLIVL